MRSLGRWFCYLLSMGLLLLPMTVYAQGLSRGMTRRQWKPGGQIRGETYHIRSKLRELRLQETRRPRDIQAAPSQNLGTPGRARPDPFGLLDMEREKINAKAGVGAFLPLATPNNQTLGPGTNVDAINMMDSETDWIKKDESSTEWWEMNERSRSQRGGGFRTRFGSRQPAQMGQRQQGTMGPPGGGMSQGVGGEGGFGGPAPGQNMPSGGGGGMGGMEGIGGGEGSAPAPGGNMPSDSGGMR